VDSSSRRVLFLPPAPGPVVFFGMHTAFSAQFTPRRNPAAAHAVIAFSTQPTSEWIEYQDCLLFSCSSFNVMPSIAITLLIVSLLLRSFLVLYAQNDSRCPTSSCRLTSSSINMSIQPPSPRLIRNTIVSCIFSAGWHLPFFPSLHDRRDEGPHFGETAFLFDGGKLDRSSPSADQEHNVASEQGLRIIRSARSAKDL